MAAYQQTVKPNLTVTEYAGLCLKFVRRVYGAPAIYPSAWEAWKHAPGRHTGAHPKDVSVPVWFSHYGYYGSPPRYANWGHVVSYVPGRGYLSSPGVKHGSMWFKTIADIERYFNAKYVGWSEGINGVRVVDAVRNKPVSKRQEFDMLLARYKHGGGKNRMRWAFFGPGFWLEVAFNSTAVKFKKQLGMEEQSFECKNEAQWNLFRRSAEAGMSEPGLKALLAAVEDGFAADDGEGLAEVVNTGDEA